MFHSTASQPSVSSKVNLWILALMKMVMLANPTARIVYIEGSDTIQLLLDKLSTKTITILYLYLAFASKYFSVTIYAFFYLESTSVIMHF